MGVSQLQSDLTLGQVPLRIHQLLGDLRYLFLGSSTEVLQSVHQRSLAPKTVNFPMEARISLYHEGFVHRELLRCSFLQLLPHGRRHVGGTPGPPPHVDGGGPDLMSLTVGPKDHRIVRRILDVGGQAQPPTFVSTPRGTVRGVLDVYGVEHTPQRVIGNESHWRLIVFFVTLYLSLVVDGACYRCGYFHNRDGPSP